MIRDSGEHWRHTLRVIGCCHAKHHVMKGSSAWRYRTCRRSTKPDRGARRRTRIHPRIIGIRCDTGVSARHRRRNRRKALAQFRGYDARPKAGNIMLSPASAGRANTGAPTAAFGLAIGDREGVGQTASAAGSGGLVRGRVASPARRSGRAGSRGSASGRPRAWPRRRRRACRHIVPGAPT